MINRKRHQVCHRNDDGAQPYRFKAQNKATDSCQFVTEAVRYEAIHHKTDAKSYAGKGISASEAQTYMQRRTERTSDPINTYQDFYVYGY